MRNKKWSNLFSLIIASIVLANSCHTVSSKRWTTEDAVVYEKDPMIRPGPSLFDFEVSSSENSPKVKRGEKKPERYYEMIDDEIYVFEPSTLGAQPFMEAMQQQQEPEVHRKPHPQQQLRQNIQHEPPKQKLPYHNIRHYPKPTHFNKVSATFIRDHQPSYPVTQLSESEAIKSDTHTIAETDTDTEVISSGRGECLTKNDKEGQCVPFRICYPVVFNMIDGQLRNHGLAKILYKASGPCDKNYTFSGWEEILKPEVPNEEDPALPVDFYNDTVCCPGLNEVNSIPQESRTMKPSLPDPEYHPPPSDSDYKTADESESEGSDYYIDEYDDHYNTFKNTEIPKITSITSDDNSTLIDTANSNSTSTSEDSEEMASQSSNSDGAESNRSEVKIENSPKGKSLKGTNEGKKSKNNSLKTHEGPVPSVVPSPHMSAWNCPGRQIGMPRGHWPWMVALLNEGSHFCSGSLIDHRHVLTTATCINSFQGKEIGKLRVILGDRVLYSSIDGPHIWRKVVRITRHISYNPMTMEHDIAMLEMDMSVSYNQNIQPINLPSSDDRSHASKAIVSGWSGPDIGKRFFAPRATSDAIVEFMNMTDCREKYDGFVPEGVPRDVICTKVSNTSCMADPGAPLMMKTDNCWHIIGILSNGLGCGTFPELFTDTSKHMEWIQKNIRHQLSGHGSFRPV